MKTLGILFSLVLSIAALASPRDLVTSNNPLRSPRIATDGTSSMLVWREETLTEIHLRSMFAAADRSQRVTDLASFNRQGDGDRGHDVTYGNGMYAIVWITDAGNVLATRFATDGSRLDPDPIVVASEGFSGVSAVWNGSSFVIVWTQYAIGIRAALLGIDGIVGDIHDVVPYNALPLQPAIASDGAGTLLLAFTGNTSDPLSGMVGSNFVIIARLDATARMLDAQATLAGAYGDSPSVASSGSEFLLTFSDWQGVRSAIVTTRPSLALSYVGTLLPWRVWYEHPRSATTWNGSSYVVAVTYQVGREPGIVRPFIANAYVNRDGTKEAMFATPAPSPFLNGFYEGPVAVASSGRGDLTTVVAHSGTTSRIAAYDPAALDVAPPPPDAPRNAVFTRTTNSWTIRWHDDSSNEEGFVLNDVSATEVPPDTVEVTRDAFQFSPILPITVSAWNAGGFSPPATASDGSTPDRRRAVR